MSDRHARADARLWRQADTELRSRESKGNLRLTASLTASAWTIVASVWSAPASRSRLRSLKNTDALQHAPTATWRASMAGVSGMAQTALITVSRPS